MRNLLLAGYRFAVASCYRVLLVVGLLGLVSTACVVNPHYSVDFSTPPEPGQLLTAQISLVSCADANSATAMALGGFFIAGCQLVRDEQRLRVLKLELLDLGQGRAVWMVEVRSDAHNVPSATSRWVPIPWHDWA